MTAVWPLPDLLDHLRGLHEIWANEAADRLAGLTAENAELKAGAIIDANLRIDPDATLAAQLAAVVAALDAYGEDKHSDIAAVFTCVSAIAKAVKT